MTVAAQGPVSRSKSALIAGFSDSGRRISEVFSPFAEKDCWSRHALKSMT